MTKGENMARGKYASSAEARRARESAEAEVDTLRRRVERLNRENTELRARLVTERATYAEYERHMNDLMREGTSEEVVRLKDKLRTARKRMESRDADRASRIIREVATLGTHDAAVVGVLYSIAEIYGVDRSVIRKMDGAKRKKISNSVMSSQFPIMESLMDRRSES